MAVPSTGAVGISDIVAEFGGASPDGLSEYYAGGGLVPAGATGNNGDVPTSGEISINDLRGSQNNAPITATGGTVSDSGGYRYHTFTTGGTFQITALAAGAFSNDVDVVIIAGGAGGLSSNNDNGVGGGAGGMVEETFAASLTSLTVTVGSAGSANGMGNDSSVTGRTTAIRGGLLANGGSGSGSYNANYYYGTAGQGNRGGSRANGAAGGGGGGGAGAVGANTYRSGGGDGGGSGGSGKAWLNGTTYAGGGGGGYGSLWYDYYGTYVNATPPGNGGSGGGGRGAGIIGWNYGNSQQIVRNSTAGSQYGAGGGGGGNYNTGSGSAGYQGVVIFRYEYS